MVEMEGSLNRGTYVNPHAGRTRFGDFAQQWLATRSVEARTTERTVSLLRAHVLPKWGDWPLGKVDFMSVQEWVTGLGRDLAPATVGKCYQLLSMILRTAVQARLIAVNPAEGVKLPRDRSRDVKPITISRKDFFGKLLPAVPPRHRAIVCAAAGAGLRWGECAGLTWSSVDLDRASLRVVQVAEETHGGIVLRPYPKSRAGVRTVPLPGFLVDALRQLHAAADNPDPRTLVFRDRVGRPLRRSNFRRRVWLPSLVRAGLLGQVVNAGPHRYRAVWPDREGVEWSAEFTTEREAVACVAAKAVSGMRFHDLRHAYATWLVTDGVPINLVQRVMGHEQASTTLDRYTHTPDDYAARVLAAFDGSAASLLPLTEETPEDEAPDEDGDDL
ncbi:tyrosine-type recombinase/integrase [Micromonospora craterilacus]|uniref:tyrosine-type recombinase/integrase n=1 Tax=Micromonospora craterilacus TaxID=1655439 RepID=UPI001F2D7CE6|nr:site-specific integrase [Micromonospora craterilacus]